MLGTPVGFLVGTFVGIVVIDVGFGDVDGLAETTAVGAVELISDGIAVPMAKGDALGIEDTVGDTVTFGMDGDVVTVTFGMDGDAVGSSLVTFN